MEKEILEKLNSLVDVDGWDDPEFMVYGDINLNHPTIKPMVDAANAVLKPDARRVSEYCGRFVIQDIPQVDEKADKELADRIHAEFIRVVPDVWYPHDPDFGKDQYSGISMRTR